MPSIGINSLKIITQMVIVASFEFDGLKGASSTLLLLLIWQVLISYFAVFHGLRDTMVVLHCLSIVLLRRKKSFSDVEELAYYFKTSSAKRHAFSSAGYIY